MLDPRTHRWSIHLFPERAHDRRSSLLGRLAAVACLALAGATPAAVAAPAPPLNYGATQCAASRVGNDLGCTAHDVSITGLRVVGDTTSCVGGSDVNLDVEVSINFATPDRYDVGVFLANDGKDPTVTPAHGGAQSCSVSVLPNSSPFLNLDPGPYNATDGKSYTDSCGDGNSGIGGGTGNGIFYMSGVKVSCKSAPGADGKLYIPFVVSWDNQSSPTGAICTSNLNPVPNTNSKCNAPTIAQGSVEVVVLPTITMDDGQTYVTSGTNTSYTIVITNTTGAALSNVIFTDPVAPNLTANRVTCSAGGGASCPPAASVTVGNMQSAAGITIPSMPSGSTVTFTVDATLRGSPPDTVTNTAYVTTGNRSGSASDTDTFYSGTISITPATLSKSASSGSSVVFTYTVYNFSAVADTVTLSTNSSQGWSETLSHTSLSVPRASGGTPGSATFTLTVQVPAGAAIGTMDISTIRAASGLGSSKATASAITTVAELFTFSPNNTGSAGPGSSVWYAHTLQNNSSETQSVTFSYAYSGNCIGWMALAYTPDKALPIAFLTMAPNGGTMDLYVKVDVPLWASVDSECTVTVTATTLPGFRSDTVYDKTTVKSLILYSDTAYTNEAYVYPQGDNVYAKSFGLNLLSRYYFRWYDPSGTEMRTSALTTAGSSTAPDTYPIAQTAPEGTWKVEVWKCKSVYKNVCTSSPSTGDTLFASSRFYVGPDHVNASYSGAAPTTSSTAVIDLALHDRYAHKIPFDAAGNLVDGNPPRTEDPLKITVTVSGSAQIVSTTLRHAVISGQTVTGELDDDTGTATITISDSVAETVTVTPHSYAAALKGSPARDEPLSIGFVVASLFDHIRIEHAGSALTCEPAPVTVTACADAACSAQATIPVTVTLVPAAGWSEQSFTFTGSKDVTLSVGTAVTVALGTSDVSPLPTGASPRCYVGATASCDLAFADTGFIFSGGSGALAATVPTQVAGVSSNTYYLRAVKKIDSSKACVAALTGTKSVDFAYECNNPATCYGANLMSVHGAGDSKPIQRNNNGATLSYTAVDLTFDADGNAPFTFNYGDVGQVQLHASRMMVNAARLIGSTNAFVVKPHHFALDSIKQTAAPNQANPAASDASGGAFVKAGEGFSVRVTAMTSGDTVTPSYGQESPKEGVKLTSTLVAPAGGNNATLENSDAFGDFTNGVATGTTFKWGEVGIIKLTPAVKDGNYLGGGDVTATASGNVGRFYPADYRLDLAQAKTCGSFTYAGHDGSAKTGQPFTLSGGITARNAAGGTTRNYDGDFAKLTAGQVSAVPRVGGATWGKLGWPAGTGSVAFTNGVGTFAKSDVSYLFASEAPPKLMYLQVTAKDGDGATGTEEDSAKTVEYRFGRVSLVNANGSDRLALPVPFRTEYFKDDGAGGGYYVLNTGDGCTKPLTSSGHLELSNPATSAGAWQAGDTAMKVGGGTTSATLDTVSGGKLPLSFSAPAAVGYVDIRTKMATDFPWLLSDWNGDGAFGEEAAGRATFGIYRGSSRHIYLRELLH